MSSHGATLIEAVRAGDPWQVRARLRCGCEIALIVPADRVLDAAPKITRSEKKNGREPVGARPFGAEKTGAQ